ncbi:CRISPR-associated endoribonuclease Cas6, partial [Thermomicrobium sp.]
EGATPAGEPMVLTDCPIRIRALGVHPRAKRLERYKGTWIEGWTGRFLIEGPPEYLRLALEAGLGAKNSQGFGYVEEVDERSLSFRGRQEQSGEEEGA